ncbi:ribosome recycling factor [Candidatus Daviesbacteria bacterium RIFCSPHIGHO2_01_FULL_44_29]|uniref:Ribosome-recycling factor n=1 Tax=Candidatus Daviesbacteria bacterium RIFCSPHIGHO2_02_FULL_43_12 TaxID=1797776 RepID=A0A1F5KI72_9BACT|nr:MAG: ribosome recycling factor [Candidatus Daviesbacteria bacterium RIFCSPHIGHO2_01_FULL_44_29]OGE39476.1 MAG: ribosome recycling factor [Candidatus Daviesbacteria bacterium RIFCSPHIGHO2_12_FULL_47_45]OGE40636.1 MAG: ribosome recycling factor [Candidatus Daviesbacteria bacterium RIFCSPHIGHO2_02_FULL_43_12]OGE69867.1 MAG: ribosome recycling factor [Candidatus Daviesbacteria bacterium RIFCSPLOWO2_01_FULL_43_15]
MDPSLTESYNRTQDALDHLLRELASIRAGKANPSLIENITVNAYGAQMKLNELGTIAAPQPSLLTVMVWDTSILHDVQKAILEANLGINPSIDGQLVRLPIPPLTEERRLEFVKLANQKGELTKIAIRQVRAEVRDAWAKEEAAGEYGEDELNRREKLLQDLIDRQVGAVDDLVKKKETELTTL